MKKVLLLVMVLIIADIAIAATISGTVYDYSFDKVDNVNVELDSVPKQRDITENGEYSFVLEPGDYTITAEYRTGGELRGTAEENVSITKEGDYLIDLILFPSIEEEQALADEDIEIEAEPAEEEGINYWAIGFGILFLIIIVYIIIRVLTKERIPPKHEEKESKETKESEKDLADDILDFIKKHKRTTQKEIRKHFPSSEAKISLVITELEHKGKIEKIKKGRGNVIVLK